MKPSEIGSKYGQKMRSVFPCSDAFINIDSSQWRSDTKRTLELIFGDPFHTPTHDELAMNMAYQASLRSSDLSRQIGACIFSPKHELVAIGCNDVPCFGGGVYWPNSENDYRDFKIGQDPNKAEINIMVKSIIENIHQKISDDFTETEQEKIKYLIEDPIKDKVKEITEYVRAVHAEMDAILSAHRKGISVKDCTIYVTTYPCHNCAKHIISSGMRQVFYIEPYPKSRAEQLHSDSMLKTNEYVSNKVVFSHFSGISPRRFESLFKIKFSDGHQIKRKDKENEHHVVTHKPRMSISCSLSIEELKKRLLTYDDLVKKLISKYFKD